MPQERAADAIRVLYIAGAGRSGSTLLANLIGEVPGCVSVGEARYVWSRGLREDRLCGCGAPFSRCSFWQAVMRRCGPVDAGRLAGLLRIRRLPRLLWLHRDPARLRAELGLLAGGLQRLYAALAEDGSVVVDSSKLPPYALFLDALPGVEVTLVHLVRDPRATAFSWMRRTPLPDRPALMERRGAAKSTALWMLWNVLLEHLRPARYVRLRYEDLVADPAGTLGRVLTAAGLDPAPPAALSQDGRSVRLGVHHTVAGNPARLAQGPIDLRLDDEWRRAMRAPDRMLVSAGAAPLMRRYGYPVRREIR